MIKENYWKFIKDYSSNMKEGSGFQVGVPAGTITSGVSTQANFTVDFLPTFLEITRQDKQGYRQPEGKT